MGFSVIFKILSFEETYQLTLNNICMSSGLEVENFLQAAIKKFNNILLQQLS